MGIVNAGQLAVYQDLHTELRSAIVAVIFNQTETAAEDLLAIANRFDSVTREQWHQQPVAERIQHALVHGINKYITEDIQVARAEVNIYLARKRFDHIGNCQRRCA